MRWLLGFLLYTSLLLESPLAQAALPLGGRTDDNLVSLIYDPSDGNLQVEGGGKLLTAVEILSSSHAFTGPRPDLMPCTPFLCEMHSAKLFVLRPGANAEPLFDFGPVVTPGLSAEVLANDLRVSGAFFPQGGLGTVDLIYVPEPATLPFVATCALLLGCTRRRPSIASQQRLGD